MGFFDREVRGSFDRLFDLNRDGALDPAEQAFQMDFITRDMEEQEDIDDEDELDLDDLEDMDPDERREALEEAGYDPDDFDMDNDGFDSDDGDF